MSIRFLSILFVSFWCSFQSLHAQDLWSDVPDYVHFDASHISFPIAEKGWMIGSDMRMMKTVDSGEHWQEFDDLFCTFLDLQFVSGNVGFVCGIRQICRASGEVVEIPHCFSISRSIKNQKSHSHNANGFQFFDETHVIKV